MDIPLQMPPLAGLGLAVRPATVFSGVKLLKDGEILTPRNRKYVVTDASNNDVDIEFKFNLFDAVPQISIDGKKYDLQRPLEWYEKALVGSPLIFMAFGGFLGALIGALGLYVNNRVMRSDRNALSRYAACAVLSLAVAVVYGIAAFSVTKAIDGGAEEHGEIVLFAASQDLGTPKAIDDFTSLESVRVESPESNTIVYTYSLDTQKQPIDFPAVQGEIYAGEKEYFCTSPDTAKIRAAGADIEYRYTDRNNKPIGNILIHLKEC